MGAGDPDQIEGDSLDDEVTERFQQHPGPFITAEEVFHLALQRIRIQDARKAGRPSREQQCLQVCAEAYSDCPGWGLVANHPASHPRILWPEYLDGASPCKPSDAAD